MKRRVALLFSVQLFTEICAYTYQGYSDMTREMMWNPQNGSILGEKIALANLNSTIKNQTAQVGSTAFLRCQVRNMADKKISWIRKRDNHILTSGLLTYSSDERFSIVRDEESEDWSLQIKFIQRRDQGLYECQVSTKTGQQSRLINLEVIVPRAKIIGGPEFHIESGSTISLTCIIEESIAVPQYIFWYRNFQMINYDQYRGGITVETTHLPNPVSLLTITNAKFVDSGNYTCSASNTESTSVNVFVSKGDVPAAIQRLNSSGQGTVLVNTKDPLKLLVIMAINMICVKTVELFAF